METRSPAYVAVLAVIAGSILMVGSLMKPVELEPEPAALPTQADSARLQRIAQRRSLEDMAEYFAETASNAAEHLVHLEHVGQTGIVWDDEGTVITSNTADPLPSALQVRGMRGTVYQVDAPPAPPESPAVTLLASEDLDMGSVVHIPAMLMDRGKWLVLAWLNSSLESAFAPALYLGFRSIQCGGRPAREVSLSMTPESEMAGAGLFDLGGRLIGVVALCDDRYVALLPESVDETLVWNRGFPGRLLAQYGLRVASLTDREKQYFGGDEEVLIRELWRGFPAETSGLLPGDLIVSFDGRPVTRPDDLQPLVLPVARQLLELVVRRGRRRVTFVLPAQANPETSVATSPQSGLILADEAGGFVVQNVLEGSASATAGIRAGDRLLTVDGSPVRTAAEARRILSSAKSNGRFVVVERDRKRWGALLD